MSDTDFPAPIGASIWDLKYRLKDRDGFPLDVTVQDTWARIAKALAAAETPEKRTYCQDLFYQVLADFKFLPAGRIVAGAGTGRNVTLSNCYVMGTIPDSMDGIFTHLKEAALTMQAGGGIGYEFSTIRPKGAHVKGVMADASGPISFMRCWDSMCRTVMSAGSRRGAMMATMDCSHPDIEDFIDAKREPGELRMFNLSVLVTDAFMDAVKADTDWRLHFEDRHGETLVEKTVRARDLWNKIIRSTYEYAEPGVIFIDRINRLHNLWYIDNIRATNPCGEKAMGPYDSCLLGSINLAKFIKSPYSHMSEIDYAGIRETVKVAIRMMDNVIDVNYFPLEAQRQKAHETRQLGLGVTGLADMLLMLGVRYGSPAAVEMAEKVMREITIAAYETSVDLAEEKGAFPAFDKTKFLGKPEERDSFVNQMIPVPIRAKMLSLGIRNSLLTSIAPTGTISLYAGNVSSGIEPIFASHYTRKVLQPDGTKVEELVEDYAIKVWRESNGQGLPPGYTDAQQLSAEDHLVMQAAVQKWTDSSISKTINVPVDMPFEDFENVYLRAYELGCKGCTTYRPNAVTGSILSVEPAPAPAAEPIRPTGITLAALSIQSTTFLKDGSKTGFFEQRKAFFKSLLARWGVEKLSDLGFEMQAAIDDISWEVDNYRDTEQIKTVEAVREESGLVIGVETTVEDAPEERPEVLQAATYKIKAGTMEHAVYVTISNAVGPDGRARPFEIFVNTKDPSHQAWMTALTRMVSAIFRRPYDSSFVIEELKAVFDPTFSAFIGGKPVPSLVAAIGGVIERHMRAIGYIGSVPPYGGSLVDDLAQRLHGKAPAFFEGFGPQCQKCFSTNLKNESGCLTCLDCGNSKCG